MAIASSIAQYISANNGELPTVTKEGPNTNALDICSANCNGAKNTTVHLSYFKNSPSSVEFHSYSSNLTAPNTSTAYIVNNAVCNSSNSGIGSQTATATVAILYEQQTGTGTKQQCISE